MPPPIIRVPLLDVTGLRIQDPPEDWFRLWKEIQLVLAVVEGIGPNGAVALAVDSSGNLKVSALGTGVNIQQIGGSGIAPPVSWASDGVNEGNEAITLPTSIMAFLHNGATADRLKSASAANLANQAGFGTLLSALPGQWAVFSNAGLGAASSGVKAAGAAGVRHILTGYQLVISSQVAPAAGQLTINIRDGASGAGTVLEAINVSIPAALYQPIVVTRSGLSLPGSAATAMTIEQSAAYAAVEASINFEGYDAS